MNRKVYESIINAGVKAADESTFIEWQNYHLLMALLFFIALVFCFAFVEIHSPGIGIAIVALAAALWGGVAIGYRASFKRSVLPFLKNLSSKYEHIEVFKSILSERTVEPSLTEQHVINEIMAKGFYEAGLNSDWASVLIIRYFADYASNNGGLLSPEELIINNVYRENIENKGAGHGAN